MKSLFRRKPAAVPAAPVYARCERVTATGSSPHHVRKLGDAGMKKSGGADTLALCGALVAWDTSPVTFEEVLEYLPRQHETFRYCAGCANAIKVNVGIEPDWPLTGVEDATIDEKLMLLSAWELAAYAHLGQVDKNGVRYIDHPVAVANMLDTVEEKAIALLHDIVEDTDVTEAELREKFPSDIVDAVMVLTHKPREARLDYIGRVVAGGEVTKRVKRADMAHNTDPRRAVVDDPKLKARLEKKYAVSAEALGTSVEAIREEFLVGARQ